MTVSTAIDNGIFTVLVGEQEVSWTAPSGASKHQIATGLTEALVALGVRATADGAAITVEG